MQQINKHYLKQSKLEENWYSICMFMLTTYKQTLRIRIYALLDHFDYLNCQSHIAWHTLKCHCSENKVILSVCDETVIQIVAGVKTLIPTWGDNWEMHKYFDRHEQCCMAKSKIEYSIPLGSQFTSIDTFSAHSLK